MVAPAPVRVANVSAIASWLAWSTPALGSSRTSSSGWPASGRGLRTPRCRAPRRGGARGGGAVGAPPGLERLRDGHLVLAPGGHEWPTPRQPPGGDDLGHRR